MWQVRHWLWRVGEFRQHDGVDVGDQALWLTGKSWICGCPGLRAPVLLGVSGLSGARRITELDSVSTCGAIHGGVSIKMINLAGYEAMSSPGRSERQTPRVQVAELLATDATASCAKVGLIV